MLITKTFMETLSENPSFKEYVEKLYGGGLEYQAAR